MIAIISWAYKGTQDLYRDSSDLRDRGEQGVIRSALIRQALMYLFAFVICWIGIPFTVFVTDQVALDVVTSILFPMTGIFNALIFIYHKVYNLKMQNREQSLNTRKALYILFFKHKQVQEMSFKGISKVEIGHMQQNGHNICAMNEDQSNNWSKDVHHRYLDEVSQHIHEHGSTNDHTRNSDLQGFQNTLQRQSEAKEESVDSLSCFSLNDFNRDADSIQASGAQNDDFDIQLSPVNKSQISSALLLSEEENLSVKSNISSNRF